MLEETVKKIDQVCKQKSWPYQKKVDFNSKIINLTAKPLNLIVLFGSENS